jgi:acyl-CoA synthetase (AMP-forming)/AMP-acid ligase II
MSLQKLDEAWEVFGPVMTQLYGLMEVTSTAAMMRPSEHAASRGAKPGRLASCGRGSPSVMIDIIDDKGNSMPPGTRGEVAIRGNTLMKGYDANPSATAEAIQNGWFRSGDIGFKDEQGYLYLVDRKKDLIISGGFNIFPGEVEQIIWTHPAVQDCAVIGVPDDKWGEAVTAVVELKPGMSLVEDDVISLCKERLGSIKAPKKVVVWQALPRSNVGKVLKKDIRAHYWKHVGRAI